jgi:hypothetical protein
MEGRKKKKFKKNVKSLIGTGVDPRSTGDCGSTPAPVKFFQILFFIFKKKEFWKFGKWARAFERMGV